MLIALYMIIKSTLDSSFFHEETEVGYSHWKIRRSCWVVMFGWGSHMALRALALSLLNCGNMSQA